MSEVIKLSAPATREYWELPVLYEDAELLAVDKPAGLLASPDRYDPERPNLMNLLHAGIAKGAPWAAQRKLAYLANAHRLDLDTSGVMLLAKSRSILITLANLFGSEKPAKIYTALAHGQPAQPQFDIAAKLVPDSNRTGAMRVDQKNGKQARTLFQVIEQFRGFTLLKCQPLTDRTHQIRVHSRYAGLPLVGDTLYDGSPLLLSGLKPGYRFKRDREEIPLIGRVALHAEELQLPHPTTGSVVSIKAPWPKNLRVAVKYLRQYAAA